MCSWPVQLRLHTLDLAEWNSNITVGGAIKRKSNKAHGIERYIYCCNVSYALVSEQIHCGVNRPLEE